jgi:hypothetical protein
METRFRFRGPLSFFRLRRTVSAFRCGLRCRFRLAIGSGTVLEHACIWILAVWLLVAVQLRLTACRLYSIYTKRIRWRSDNIGESKIYKMSNTKTITLTQNDYNNITKAFFFYLENEKDLNLNQNEIKSILNTNSKIQ